MKIRKNEKIIIFGIGKKWAYIRNAYGSFLEKYDIVAYVDNNSKLWGTLQDGQLIASPSSVQTAEYDIIVLMADYIKSMKKQLLQLGVPEDKIASWEAFFGRMQKGRFYEYGNSSVSASFQIRILIISTELNYNGGTIAIFNAAMALSLYGYDVTVSAPSGNRKMIEEMVGKKIRIVIVPAIQYPGEVEFKWIRQFDIVIVNVFQMIRCACEINCIRPVIWWIHECSDRYDKIYSWIRDNYAEYDDVSAMQNIKIVAVSAVAQKNFNYYYKDRIRDVLPYGIPDQYSGRMNDTGHKYIFAVIGSVLQRKAQLVFLDAIAMLAEEEKQNAEFWIIGYCGEDAYSRQVRKQAEQMPEVKILGELDQEHIHEKYKEIAVVVCSSLEETMSMTITEGMMNAKVCITTDATGMADYIEDGVNGFVCPAGNAKSLCEKMRWIIHHPKQCKEIGKNARSVYEAYFTLEKFAQRLQTIMKSVMEDRAFNETDLHLFDI